MPTIIQLPPLTEEPKQEGGPTLSSNGTPASSMSTNDYRLHRNPFILLEEEIETEQEQLRRRESIWISLIVHAVVVLLLIYAMPRLMRVHHVEGSTLAEMLQNHDLTFLQLPPTPKVETPKETNKISDQDRVARTRRPTLDQKTLKQLQDASRAGTPGAMRAPAQQSASQQSQAAPPNPANNQGVDNQMARLESQRQANAAKGNNNPFGAPTSATSALEQALRGAASNHKYSGTGGEYGIGPLQQQTKLRSDFDVLSDTLGVDFGPYLARVLQDIRQNWYNIIPEEARAPLMKSGKVSIEFAITKNGRIDGIRMVSESGDTALDRAAWGGISASNPFQPLPAEFRGQYLALRVHFLYNPERSELR